MANTQADLPGPPKRIDAIDTFRGITIFLMIFVIAVAAGGYPDLPNTGSWFNSLPVSTWFHAEVAWEQFVDHKLDQGYTTDQINAMPEARLKDIGMTLTDLVAPFFVFIVGLCIPLSRARRGKQWWHRVTSRTVMLIVAGVLYISLILGLSWWWGILQTIGISYLIASLSMKLNHRGRWLMIFALLALHTMLSLTVEWWLHFGETDQPFFIISNLTGSMARPLRIHCLPWVSISYGVITTIGVLLGESVATRDPKTILRSSLFLGVLFFTLGWTLHRIGLASGLTELAFNKSDVTASYAMASTGLASLFFGLIYWIMDVKKWSRWSWPFTVLGVNALLAYFMQIIMRLFFRALHIEAFFSADPTHPTLVQWAGLWDHPLWRSFWLDKSGANGMLWGLIWCLCLWLIIYGCNKRNIFWKL